jgi:hypothetical protein
MRMTASESREVCAESVQNRVDSGWRKGRVFYRREKARGNAVLREGQDGILS